MSTAIEESRLTELYKSFTDNFGGEPQLVVRAPGRVNLIGEHTDYNEGFVFPVAIDRDIMIAARPTSEDFIEIYSEDYKQRDRFSTKSILKTEEPAWSNYARGTLAVLASRKFPVSGFQAVSSSNLPQGAGLSSSAAYEVALLYLIDKLNDLSLSRKQIALFAQEAENDFVGVKCGIMDQFIATFGETDSGLLIDCRNLDYKPIPLNLKARRLSLVIVHSGVKRGLVDSEYNERRSQCAEGVRLLSQKLNRQLKSLREVDVEDFEAVSRALPETISRRCRHVITENARVLDTVEALKEENLKRVGHLLAASHESLKTDFQVSLPPVDILVELTKKHPGVKGARISGAGFGGCIVALIDKNAVDSYSTTVPQEYFKRTGLKATVYDCQAAAGVHVLNDRA